MENDTEFLNMVVDEFSEDLIDLGIAIIPASSELVFKLRQRFNDLEYIKANGYTGVYLSSVIDLDHYHKFINTFSSLNKKKTEILPLLKELVEISRNNGTSIEDEIRKLYGSSLD
ncbi:hypothetical protein [Bacillus sp. T33-2]|uniref:hypothetical protein n=1 Tax=Bacillus sp. T33-2 TaxID=2054168 RepID=UPI000C79186C|nr:hypothetical protein [Bacillus sp. T33-2]PLR99576.1 hypothetical protein CVD19_00500 [Bacillus sp. T33-2]